MASADSTNQTAAWKRLDGIDLLRGLAIFFVLMNHINIRRLGAKVPYLKFLPEQLAHFLVWNGQLGVHGFFVVSGFLITSMSFRRWDALSRIAATAQVQRKSLRILTPLLGLGQHEL